MLTMPAAHSSVGQDSKATVKRQSDSDALVWIANQLYSKACNQIWQVYLSAGTWCH